MADHALKAVEAFFDRYINFDICKACVAYYAQWAVPVVTDRVSADGQRKGVVPSLYPYMWAKVDDSDPNNPVSHNAPSTTIC